MNRMTLAVFQAMTCTYVKTNELLAIFFPFLFTVHCNSALVQPCVLKADVS